MRTILGWPRPEVKEGSARTFGGGTESLSVGTRIRQIRSDPRS